jgi:hypothetical protein
MSAIPLGLLSVAFLSTLAAVALLARTYRGLRVIICPESRSPEVVEVDAARAAWTALFSRRDLRLSSCSRWPEKSGCGQECLKEVEETPDGCLVRERLTRWYAGKSCAICGKAFGEIRWHDHKPALATLERQILRWDDVPPRELAETLTTHFPVCWDCDVAETFRRNFSDLVLDDSRPLHGTGPAG